MNCLIVDDDELMREILETLISKVKTLRLIKSCSSAIEATQVMMEEKIDLLFLDIQMPEMSGLDLIKVIPEPKPQIILITSNKEYAVESYDFDVTDFIVKPITQERFLKAVSKAKKNEETASTGSFTDQDIYVKINGALIKLNTKDIFLIESETDNLIIYTNTEKYILHSTLKKLQAKLPSGLFMRANNSFMVRFDKISKIDDNMVVINDKFIPLNPSNKTKLLKRLKVI